MAVIKSPRRILLNITLFLTSLFMAAFFAMPAQAQDKPPKPILISNVQIFDGHNLITSSGSVRVVGDKISEVSLGQLSAKPEDYVIDGGGKFLMPGLIDAHVHVSWAFPFSKAPQAGDSYTAVTAVANAAKMLKRGFTTVRDTAGTDYGLAYAIDEGVVPGPRIIFTGRSITQTGGHADHRDIKAPSTDRISFVFGASVADGTDEVTKAAREELRKGAKFIKIHAGGGVSSPLDPMHSIQYSPQEMAAAVQSAKDWGTYVAAHAYTPESITRALNAGVMTIEHANLIDKDTAKLAAQKGAYVVPNLVTYWAMDKAPNMPAYIKAKNKYVLDAMEDALKTLKAENVKIAFGTDLIADMHGLQNQEFVLRAQVFTPLEILRQVTSVNGSLIELSGPLNPYGKVGVIEKGAIADFILVDGNPLKDIRLMANPEANFSLIIKDGKMID